MCVLKDETVLVAAVEGVAYCLNNRANSIIRSWQL